MSLLLCVQFVEPVLHVAEGAEQVEPGLAQVESGVECVFRYFWRSSMRASCSALGESCGWRVGAAGGAVAEFQLRQDALQLLHRQSAA